MVPLAVVGALLERVGLLMQNADKGGNQRQDSPPDRDAQAQWDELAKNLYPENKHCPKACTGWFGVTAKGEADELMFFDGTETADEREALIAAFTAHTLALAHSRAHANAAAKAAVSCTHYNGPCHNADYSGLEGFSHESSPNVTDKFVELDIFVERQELWHCDP
jgi:hypothetical protein